MKKETAESLTTSPMKELWIKSVSSKFSRVIYGNKHGVAYTDTIDFIAKQDVPPDKKVTYTSLLFDYRPLKDEEYRYCIVMGVN